MATSRKRRQREKKTGMMRTDAEKLPQYKVSGGETVFAKGPEISSVPEVVKTESVTPAPELIYAPILPHELTVLVPLIKEFYKEIGYKEAVENPDPLIKEIFEELSGNPYSIIYACVNQSMVPQGYMWLRIDRNPWGAPFAVIEHDYIIPEHRGTLREARMHHRFIEYAIEVGERCGIQYVNTVVRTKRLEESRAKLGFKSVELKLTFRGTAQDFKNQNPSFQKYGKYTEGK